MDRPRMTHDELELFLEKVKFWHKHKRHLSHRLFEADAISYVSRFGYKFEFQRHKRAPGYYIVVKV